DFELVRDAGEHVFELYRNATPETPLLYRGFKRTWEIVDACRDIAKGCKLDEEDFEVVLLAAWFHDAGYAVGTDADPARSVEVARKFLSDRPGRNGLSERVIACLGVAAGADGQQRTVCDDVLYDGLVASLASKSYVEQTELLRVETERREG